MNYVILTSRDWNEVLVKRLARKTKHKFILINDRQDLTLHKLDKYKPRYIFIPHWSYIIPKEVFNKYECVIFHMTDLPFGRGGSPLQNLISREIYETKISAIRCSERIDAGPVYLKTSLSLYGTAEEIFLRALDNIEEMIEKMIDEEPKPVKQKGKVVTFRRRKPEEGNISKLSSLIEVFDYIRMLDAKGYPQAFLKSGKFMFEFSRASLKSGKIVADVNISIVEK
jgi:methionyl-tRNA formyltransferase